MVSICLDIGFCRRDMNYWLPFLREPNQEITVFSVWVETVCNPKAMKFECNSFNVGGFWLHFLVPAIFFAGFEVLTALYPRMLFWDMMLCHWVIRSQCFEALQYPHSQWWKWPFLDILTLGDDGVRMCFFLWCFDLWRWWSVASKQDLITWRYSIISQESGIHLCVCFPYHKFFLFKAVVSVTVFFSIPLFVQVVHDSNHNLSTSSRDWFIWFFSVSSGEFQETTLKLM